LRKKGKRKISLWPKETENKILPMPIKYQELVRKMESQFLKSDLPSIEVGDTVKVGVLIQEGNKERVQPYEGTVIAKRRAGLHTTITVRRVFQGIGVERVFTPHSPAIKKLEVLKRAKVRRAKLYYLRDRSGKGTRLTPRLEN
jgi:large subunit ribosomal protein L19